jgi:type II secretory pathway pseudopilin PulG
VKPETISTFLGLDPSDWVVIAIGAATIIIGWLGSQRGAAVAEKQTSAATRLAQAAEKQLAASTAAHEREQSAILVATRGGYDVNYGDVILSNGGLHPATGIEVVPLDDSGTPIASATQPMVRAGDVEPVRVQLNNSVEAREQFGRSDAVMLTWTDGRGRRGPERVEMFRLP